MFDMLVGRRSLVGSRRLLSGENSRLGAESCPLLPHIGLGVCARDTSWNRSSVRVRDQGSWGWGTRMHRDIPGIWTHTAAGGDEMVIGSRL